MFKYILIWFCTIAFTVQTCTPQTCNCIQDICESCLHQNFFKNNNNTCVPCDYRCSKCTSSQSCTQCRDTFYLVDGVCQLCELNCAKCNQSECNKCLDGYSIVNNNCQLCSDINALSCDTVSLPTQCKEGYWQNGNLCSNCRQFCILCTSSVNCLECQEGYQVVMSSGTYCRACGVGCLGCQGGVCLECQLGYQLSGGECAFINSTSIANCLHYTHNTNNELVCQVCQPEHYLQDNVCLLGSSLACQSSSTGNNFYQCSQQCLSPFELVAQNGQSLVCLPKTWQEHGSVAIFYINQYSHKFSESVVQDQLWVNLKVKFKAYYKFIVKGKFEVVGEGQSLVNITAIDHSNSSQTFQISTNFSSGYFYPTFTVKKLKQKELTINFSSNYSIKFKEILIAVYQCDPKCEVCYNSQLCKYCKEDWFTSLDYICVQSCEGLLELVQRDGNISRKRCVSQCQVGYYLVYDLSFGGFFCGVCVEPCLTCTSELQCLSCVGQYLFNLMDFSCVKQCPNTHYNTTNTCQLCNLPCSTCTSPEYCLSCSIGFHLNGSCSSSCPNGTYPEPSNNTCATCSSTCLSCSNSASLCLSCQGGLVLYQSSCLTNCLTSTYYNQSGVCVACQEPCLECIGVSICLSCRSGFLVNGSCPNSCQKGFYGNLINNSCEACSSDCQSCISFQFCSQCANNLTLYGYNCISSCPQGLYSWQQICISCQSPCSSCINQTYCLTCSRGFLSQLQQGTCLDQCEDGYFSEGNLCSKCHSNCKTCSNAINCIQCQTTSGLVLQANMCQPQCSQGSYNLSGVCYPCNAKCISCINTQDNCTSCQLAFIHYNWSCIIQCPTSTFQQNLTCHQCSYPCQQCMDELICLSCVDLNQSLLLFQDRCIQSCPLATFQRGVVCLSCVAPCGQCLNQTFCISCQSGYLLQGQCTICPPQYLPNDNTKQCDACSLYLSNCQQCVSQQLCSNCHPDYFLFNAKCITSQQCLVNGTHFLRQYDQSCNECWQPCLRCLNQTFCLSCGSNYLIENGACLAVCSEGFYTSNNSCLSCSTNCHTCIQFTKCLTCNQTSNNNILKQQQCISKQQCGQQYFIDTTYGQPQCLKCQLPCLTCNSSTYCLSCQVGILMGGGCQSVCPRGYFTSNNGSNNGISPYCQECSSSCLKCVGGFDFCVQCASSLLFEGNRCVSNCSDLYYLDSVLGKCFRCVSPCLTCNSPSQCLSCNNSTHILYISRCLTSCPDGSYSDNGSCLDCPSECQTCELIEGNIECKQCSLNLFKGVDQICRNSCSVTYYPSHLTRYCYPCVDPCLECDSSISCRSCLSGYLHYGVECFQGEVCPQPSFKQNDTHCLQYCAIGFADSLLRECVQVCSNKQLMLTNTNNQNICKEQCPSGYYVEAGFKCVRCGGQCPNMQQFALSARTIFNQLYIRLLFSEKLDIRQINSSILVLLLENSNQRLLNTQGVMFVIIQQEQNAIWLKLSLKTSLQQQTINLQFQDYYVLGQPYLQSVSKTIFIQSFDYYGQEQRDEASSFETYSKVISAIMVLLFGLNILLNSGYLSYNIIDYYQLLFMLLFLEIDYPPHLNHFLFGFRFSHYLFLPQIFSSKTVYQANKFGILLVDADFLNNTGHDFIVLFFGVGILGVCKFIQVVIHCRNNNKVVNLNQIQSEPQKKSEQQQHKARSQENTKQNNSKLSKFITKILKRYKWNYFNDLVYSIYFFIMLFAFTQIYNLSLPGQKMRSILSKLLAFAFIIMGIGYPILIGYLLKKKEQEIILENQSKEVSQLKRSESNQKEMIDNISDDKESERFRNFVEDQYELLEEFKCFIFNIKTRVRVGFFQIPIKYARKLILALLLCFYSAHPTFIIGIIVVSSLLNILVILIFKPYRLNFEQVFYSIFEALFIVFFVSILLMQMQYMNFDTDDKKKIGIFSVVVCILVSALLILYNIVAIVVEAIKFFCGIDYFKAYYSYQCSIQSEREVKETDKNPTAEKQASGDNISDSSSSGLDFYIHKEFKAPPILIKCVRDYRDQINQEKQVSPVPKDQGEDEFGEEEIVKKTVEQQSEKEQRQKFQEKKKVMQNLGVLQVFGFEQDESKQQPQI